MRPRYLKFVDVGILRYSFGRNSVRRGKSVYKCLLEASGDIDGKRILDVGTGYGAIFFPNYNSTRPSEIIGLDYSIKMLKTAKKNAKKLNEKYDIKTIILQGSATELPFPDESMDVIIDSLCMPWLAIPGVEQHKDALSEYKRVLTDEGSLVLYPSRGPQSKKINSAVHELFPCREEVVVLPSGFKFFKCSALLLKKEKTE